MRQSQRPRDERAGRGDEAVGVNGIKARATSGMQQRLKLLHPGLESTHRGHWFIARQPARDWHDADRNVDRLQHGAAGPVKGQEHMGVASMRAQSGHEVQQ